MKMFSISIDTLIWRFYLMMAIVLVAVLSHNFLIAIVALPVFLSCMLGVQFRPGSKDDTKEDKIEGPTKNLKQHPMAA